MVKLINQQLNYRHYFKQLTAIGLLLWTTLLLAEPVQVSVDRDTVAINQSFQITFTATEEVDSSPDFSALEKNFEIIDRNRSSNVSWVNGVSSSSTQWTFDVMAKQAGKLAIPPVRFGKETSPALTITVTEDAQQAQTANNNAELFLEVEATPTKVFVQSQVLFTLHFYRRVNIAEASLKDPELADAVVTKLGEDKSYKRQLKGVDYAVTERRYAIFPQKSGQLTVPPLVLTAAVLADEQSGMGGFFGTRTTRTERVVSKPLTLTVLPASSAFSGQWLAAEQVELKQAWSADVQKAKVGEPLTRTLTLQATGTTVGQLPQLYQADSNNDLKTYPDQPKLTEQKTPDGIVAVREEKIAFIPAKAGIYIVPALKVAWFNVKTQQLQTAQLAAMSITVIGASATSANPPMPVAVDKTVENPVDKNSIVHKPANDVAIAPVQTSSANPIWQALAGFFALAWLITLAVWLKQKFSTPSEQTDSQAARHVNKKTHYLSLKKACMNHDVQAAKQALLDYGAAHYPVNNLNALAEYCVPELQQQILSLSHCLYGKNKVNFQGDALWRAFNQQLKKAKPKSFADDKLEPLHRL
jgi:hypothetical protein